jgi:Tol biopolymer transport system component
LAKQDQPRQVTFSTNIIKTDAMWSSDGKQIYFIGSRYDTESEFLRGAIYRVDLAGDGSETLLFESEIFSPANILWHYK